jgi:protein TonB
MLRQTPVSQFGSRKPAALVGSVLTHLLVVGLLFIWPPFKVTAPVPTDLAVEIAFQPSAEPVTATPPEPALVPLTPEPPLEQMPAEPVPPEPTQALPSPLPVAMETPQPPRPTPPLRSPPRPPSRPRPTVIAPPAPATQPALPPAPTNETAPSQMSAAWRQALAAWLADHKTYPDEARRRGAEGSVTLRFTIDRAGRVLGVMLLRSSGSSILDAAAEAMLRGATLPAPPATMTQDTFTVTVQVRYALAN